MKQARLRTPYSSLSLFFDLFDLFLCLILYILFILQRRSASSNS